MVAPVISALCFHAWTEQGFPGAGNIDFNSCSEQAEAEILLKGTSENISSSEVFQRFPSQQESLELLFGAGVQLASPPQLPQEQQEAPGFYAPAHPETHCQGCSAFLGKPARQARQKYPQNSKEKAGRPGGKQQGGAS